MSDPPLIVSVLKGNGIGPEIIKSTIAVLESTCINFEWREVPIAEESIKLYGHPIAPEVVAQLRQTKHCIKAPLIVKPGQGKTVCVQPDGSQSTYPSLNNAVRRELGLFVNVRPIRGYTGVSGAYEDLDIAIMREVTEDVYIGHEHGIGNDLAAEAIKLTTRSASLRVAKYGFEYAVRMKRERVTCVHKANVLGMTDGLFLRCFYEVAAQYPQFKVDDVMIDAACYLIVKDPKRFDVVVTPNQYGDIFSDLAAGLVGSLGLAPGANISDDVCTYEASHGAAPDIAGLGIANPLALILSGVEMLRNAAYQKQADAVQRAIAEFLQKKQYLTPDLGGIAKTEEMTAALVQGVRSQLTEDGPAGRTVKF
ncbi:hypothetical protein M409DRAFT_51507 [Zasmidium cellare ATCC 36951]|uniref:Isopropylmalate dehydrogenase-like domain-containing protein n=1 Tax=Zasmidium cellare ATCC 36951 TaxID=1080233 RepID=A0A6A6CW83_ZASCE|nr:uncharacterized protein M409DRAFT_51507 [Zasmidium cellare ATCC 36951]KAF2170468.1 hypothetical protein M409DRAFT_51507 [Zasmidium cellare ATCC 36951]